MRKLTGLPAGPGIALGSAFNYSRGILHVERSHIDNVNLEFDKLESALRQAEIDLKALTEQASQAVGKAESKIFEAQIAMLRDPELLKRVQDSVKEQEVNIGFAWQEAIQFFAETLRKVDDEYLAARAADVEEVGQRVLALLLGQPLHLRKPEAPSIILADELTPADTILIDRANVLAFCTQGGGPTSHVAILSKAQGVPCIIGLGAELATIENGTFLVVDGNKGEILVDPDIPTKNEYESKAEGQMNLQQVAIKNALLPAETSDRKKIEVVANVGSYKDAAEAPGYGAEGIGLLRTEFLYMERDTLPDEEEQYQAYSEILEVFGKLPVVLRTSDIGGDKELPYLDLVKESNPFLGVRGLRLALAHPDKLLRPQLRAALRAGNGHDLRVMFPMVAALTEIRQARKIMEACQAELVRERKPIGAKLQVGIMIEVPSAALMADIFAPEVDFFSIGTNDLTQYTLAADRTNSQLAYLTSAFSPAVLRLIQNVIIQAHKYGKWVGLCGELAGEPLAIPILIGLGLDEFSMNPPAIPMAKQIIRGLTVPECQELADEILKLESGEAVKAYVGEKMSKIIGF